MSSAGRRERVLPSSISNGRMFDLERWTGTITEDESFDQKEPFAGKQITVSESHRYDTKHGHYDGGGPFYTAKEEVKLNSQPCRLFRTRGPNHFLVYEGPICIYPPAQVDLENETGSGYSPFRDEDTSSLDADGATAISLVSPVNPVSNLGTSVAEAFRERKLFSLPGIQTWRNRTNVARGAGSEYLNAQFGWLPLVDEVNNVVNATRHHREILNQYHRDEGRNVRREFEFPIETSTHAWETTVRPLINNSSFMQPADGLFSQNVGKWNASVVVNRTTRKWFSGAFTYGLPSSTDSWRKALGYGSDADKLYGTTLTPDVLWELTPWSWAVDWFSNTGDVIKNITNFELAGQVMRYGYMMEESIEQVDIRGTLIPGSVEESLFGQPEIQCPSVLHSSVLIRTKVRRPANPFGFGIGWEGLSPTQLAITAAIGITRL